MSGWMDSLHLLRPHWLWALPALPALWALWRMRQRNDNVWKGVVDTHLLPHLLEYGGRAVRGAVWMGALGYAVAILALAGPSWRQGEQPLWQSHSPLVIALDLSSSIAASDLPPSRLLQARAKLDTLLRERAGGQVALVVYAGEAFTVAPLTDDAANVALFLDALEPEVMPVDGQQPGKAIAWSVRLLQQAGFERGDIVLVSDHADAAAYGAAAEALRQGYRVSALGLGTAAGAPYRTAEGRIAQARLQAGTLRALSAAGGGRYQTITADDSDLRALELLVPRETNASAARGKKGLAWQDEGYWLLPPLMLLALFAFRRGGAFAAIALCLCLPLAMPGTAQAAESDWWQRTDQREHARIEQGADAYRKGDYSAAEQAFTGIDSSDAWYNQANALAKQGKYDEAIAAYDQALKRQPKMEDAIENRKVVDAARKRKPQGGQNQNQNQDQGKQKDQQQKNGQAGDGKTEPKQQPSDAQGNAQNSQQTPPKTGAGRTPEQPRTPQQQAADAKAQQAADAAQRQRMQQAMAQAGKQSAQADKNDPQAAARATETPEQRERRQAVEAWLRRVPD
ncbi:MAG TPA: tetratricopeptide repeat protein, partial [Pseudoxanthomonas sp.]|nr:tetratricopeptide repeat protein [Pseudoxanthomonas sp.]